MIKRELTFFVFIGSATVLIDYTFYNGLISSELMRVELAKAISFLAGTIFAYFANRFGTFGLESQDVGSVWRFVFLYAISLFVNVIINSLILVLLNGKSASISVAFLLATFISACINFLGMKFFVFKSKPVLRKS